MIIMLEEYDSKSNYFFTPPMSKHEAFKTIIDLNACNTGKHSFDTISAINLPEFEELFYRVMQLQTSRDKKIGFSSVADICVNYMTKGSPFAYSSSIERGQYAHDKLQDIEDWMLI